MRLVEGARAAEDAEAGIALNILLAVLTLVFLLLVVVTLEPFARYRGAGDPDSRC